MENLLKPDIGLIFWTFLNFAILVFVLAKTAWKPLLKAIKEREERLRRSVRDSEIARDSAQKIKTELEQKMKSLTQKEDEVLQKAKAQADARTDVIIKAAKEKAENIITEAKKELTAEKEKLSKSLRTEIADISIELTKKMIAKSLDKSDNKKLIDGFLKDLNKTAK